MPKENPEKQSEAFYKVLKEILETQNEIIKRLDSLPKSGTTVSAAEKWKRL